MPSRGLQTYDVHTWNTFVSSGVNVTPATRKLIETIMPYYPSACRCITGYQDRKSVVEGKRGDLGGRRIIKKKTKGKRRRLDTSDRGLSERCRSRRSPYD